MSLLDILNASGIIITAIATGILAFITHRYVKLTREILKASDTPEVRVFLSQISAGPSVYTLDLCIENIGTGFARDVHFSGDFLSLRQQFSNTPLAEYNDMKNGRSHLGAGKQIRIPLFFAYKQSDLPERTYNAVVDYRDSAGKGHRREFELDFAKVEGYPQIENPSLHSIAQTLRSIYGHLLDQKKERDS